MGECNWGVVWSVFNFIIGLLIVVANLDISLCAGFNILFGLCIAWVAITTKFCDQYALKWFPFWNNFLFMGVTFIYFGCGALNCFQSDFGVCWFFFFVLLVGILYVILWLVKTCAGVGVPDPVPLESCC